MPILKTVKGALKPPLVAEGILHHDKKALTECQTKCASRVAMTIQMEQEAYLSQHPEVIALSKMLIAKTVESGKRKREQLKFIANFFTRPEHELDKDVRKVLNIPPDVPYTDAMHSVYHHDDMHSLKQDIMDIILKYYPPEPWKVPSSTVTTPDTLSSSFISLVTSDTTLPTPEPIPIPEPTIYELFYAIVSMTVDKAIFLHVDDQTLRYDTAYVELMKAVEEAMEIPVIEIRQDIAELFYNAYKMFELDIMEKERIAAELAWSKRMRKKLKRTLRRLHNFKGYETPPTPKSTTSSHESYMKPPQKPCKCQPQFYYNRYQKDRFGIYVPRQDNFSALNTTITPAISVEDITEDAGGDADTKSVTSKKSKNVNFEKK